MERRLQQYDKCLHSSLEVTWKAFYLCDQRMKVGELFFCFHFTLVSASLTFVLAERLVHLAFRAKGAQPNIYKCPGCQKRHVEFYNLEEVGGYDAVESDVVNAIRATGQQKIIR